MEKGRSALLNKDDDEEFYEKIEAPKYVDFTVPDPPLPDDRSWFCSRVGCDLKHEEDMDPDAIYRSFVLRVMAARSPNIKLQKAMSRLASHATTGCPQSAPAKSSKNRISRFTAITLASQKMADKTPKAHPMSKFNSVSNAKAMTTPRSKKRLPGPDPLCSAENPKRAVSLTKNRVVSKALIFNSPKKDERVKTSSHLHKPVTELCKQVKKLEITSQQKQGRHSRIVPSRYIASNKVPTSKISKAHLKPRKLKSQAEVPFISRGPKNGQIAETSRCLKSKTKANLPQSNQSLSHERIDDDSSDMEIDGKSRDGSLEASSGSESSENHGNTGHNKPLTTVEASDNLGAISTEDESNPTGEHALAGSSNVAALLSNSEDGGLTYEERKDSEVGIPKHRTQEENLGANCTQDENNPIGKNPFARSSDVAAVPSNLEDRGMNYKESKDLVVVTKHQTPNAARIENYAVESDDKENALLPDDNREINIKNSHSKTHEAHEKSEKVIREFGKRDCSTSVASVAPKYNKTKPTNPKPFRLRTDERSILKEANLDKRLHLLAPSKEKATVQKLSTGRLRRRHLMETQKTEPSHQGTQTESGKPVRKQLKNGFLKPSKCATETKVVSTIQKSQMVQDGKERAGQEVENSSKKSTLPLRKQLVKPQRKPSASKATLASISQLRTIKETSSSNSRRRKVVEPTDNGNTNTISSKATAIRSCSRGKRPLTIPKEPNFQCGRIPKSCSKKLSQTTLISS